MFVLALDTSTPAVVAAVLTDAAQVRAARAVVTSRGHGELLTPSIAGCLDDAGLAPRDIGAVVAGLGPGPFTSLRIGLITAAAFADALGIPTYGVCSLDAIAAPGEGESVVVTDARRHEVYWARYDDHGGRVDGPHVDRPADVPLAGVSTLAGPAVELYRDVWPAHVTRRPGRHPEPLNLLALAGGRIAAGAPAEVLTPLYLRRPDAVVPGAPKAVSQR